MGCETCKHGFFNSGGGQHKYICKKSPMRCETEEQQAIQLWRMTTNRNKWSDDGCPGFEEEKNENKMIKGKIARVEDLLARLRTKYFDKEILIDLPLFQLDDFPRLIQEVMELEAEAKLFYKLRKWAARRDCEYPIGLERNCGDCLPCRARMGERDSDR